jgi:CRISPR-associated protein Csx10
MEVIPLTITALGPLAFPERKPGVQFRQSLPYIPGAALYGALGQVLDRQKQYNEKLFRALRCHNAYAALTGDKWVRPLPATAIQPKGDDEWQPHDSLYARVCWEQQQPSALIYAPTDASGRPWEAVGARFYGSAGFGKRKVQQRTLTRVSINRRRGTAEDQRLYSFLALSEVTEQQPTVFRGSIVCPAEQRSLVVQALQAITHLGGRQTSGMGAVAVSEAEAAPQPDNADAILQRVQTMTARFGQQAKQYNDLGATRPWPNDAGSIFTINLLSDAILLEHGWLPTNEFSAAALEELTGIKADLVRGFATTHVVGGWQVSWQRPKASALAVRMSGLWVFATEAPLTKDECAQLAALQLDGIGERRAEGYGQVRVCDNFHLKEPQP